jgi:hypothetical protein
MRKRVEAEDSEVPEKCAIHVQKYYMRQPKGLHMAINTSAQKFVDRQQLNDLNRYLLFFPKENLKQLDQDEIIEILDQAKNRDPEWHGEIVNSNIDIFEMSYEESVS